MSGSYDDMINLPHPVSGMRSRMPMSDRAAQFSPFAALTGYDAAVKETARRTESRLELEEDEKAVLDEKLRELGGEIGNQPKVRITYFLPDGRKVGGAYVDVVGCVKKFDRVNGMIEMVDGSVIPIEDVVGVVRFGI